MNNSHTTDMSRERVDLTHRFRIPELMDDPNLEQGLHRQALQGLRRINRFSFSSAGVWSAIRALAKKPDCNKLRVLDVACGGGDVTVDIAKRATRAGLAIQVDGCDISPLAVEESNRFAKLQNVENANFFKLDVLDENLPHGYDVIMCSLFLHHLDKADACQLMKKMSSTALHLVLINDLRRTGLGYSLAQLGCHILTRSHIVHYDGPLSVRSAFTDQEVLELATEAGMQGATLSHRWPQRFLLSWSLSR